MNGARVTDIPELTYCWKYENFYLAGQPGAESFNTFKELGVKTVVNMRDSGEGDFSFEGKLCNQYGMKYVHVPIMVGGMLSKPACDQVSAMVDDQPTVIHCASANRVCGWLITHLVTKKGMDFDDAVDVATSLGLTNPSFISQAENVLNS